MGARGKISKAGGDVVALRIERVVRVHPPADLAPDALVIWHEVVNAMPADWFQPASAHLLAQYCRHVAELSSLDQLLKSIKADAEFDVKAYGECLGLRDREGRAAGVLAVKLRLTPSSIYKSEKKRSPGMASHKPWDDDQAATG